MAEPDLLVAVDDAPLRAWVLRLGALAGVASTAVAAADAPGCWSAASAVVVDETAAATCLRARTIRRPHVLLVASGDVAATCWPVAVGLGAEAVLALPQQERELLDRLAQLREPAARGRVVCCVPGRAGVGASTFAATLALVAGARGIPSLLVDVDRWGGGIDVLLGIEDVPGARWEDLADASGLLPGAALAEALPAVGQVRVLACAPGTEPLPIQAVDAVVAAGRRGFELIVVDEPAARDDAAGRIGLAADAVVLVVPAEVRGVRAAKAVAAALGTRCPQPRLVVRHPGPADLRPRDVASALELPLGAVWPWERRLGRVVEAGSLSRSWRRTTVARVAARLLDELPALPAA